MSQRKESKMSDPIENIRREMVKEINSKESEREAMEREHGQVWNTKELQEDFSVMDSWLHLLLSPENPMAKVEA